MSDPQTKLGKLITEENPQRDAIHIAVAPVIAASSLEPGESIGFIKPDNETVSDQAKVKIGIVDPFLKGTVFAGDRFWMFLKPNTITGLKHVWEHPAFTTKVEGNPFLSKLWMKQYAQQWDMTAERLIRAATDYLDYGNRLSDGGRFEGESVSREFWDHYEKITGRTVPDLDKNDSFFSCSC